MNACLYLRSNLCTASILRNMTWYNTENNPHHSWEEEPKGPCYFDWGTSLMVKENAR